MRKTPDMNFWPSPACIYTYAFPPTHTCTHTWTCIYTQKVVTVCHTMSNALAEQGARKESNSHSHTRCMCTFPHHRELLRPTDNHSGSYESPVICQALEAHQEVGDSPWSDALGSHGALLIGSFTAILPLKQWKESTKDFPAFFQKLTKNPAQSICCSWSHISLSGSGVSGKLPWNLINQCGLCTTGGDPLWESCWNAGCFLRVLELFLHAPICKVLSRAPVHAQLVQLLDFEITFCWNAALFIIFLLY